MDKELGLCLERKNKTSRLSDFFIRSRKVKIIKVGILNK